MRVKLFQIGSIYFRLDLTVIDKFNVLLGFNYCEGSYVACTDDTMEDCAQFEYAEFQIGLLFFTISIGKEFYGK